MKSSQFCFLELFAVFSSINESITTDALVYLLMLYQMRLLAKGLRADLAPEGFLAGVRSKVHFDVAFVQEASIADRTPMDRFLLPQQPTQIVGRLKAVRGNRHVCLILYLLLHLLLVAVGATR